MAHRQTKKGTTSSVRELLRDVGEDVGKELRSEGEAPPPLWPVLTLPPPPKTHDRRRLESARRILKRLREADSFRVLQRRSTEEWTLQDVVAHLPAEPAEMARYVPEELWRSSHGKRPPPPPPPKRRRADSSGSLPFPDARDDDDPAHNPSQHNNNNADDVVADADDDEDDGLDDEPDDYMHNHYDSDGDDSGGNADHEAIFY